MKIDIVTIWLVSFAICFAFQNFFTAKSSSWDVTYTYTSNRIDYIGFGQTHIGVRYTDKLTMGEAKVWLQDHLNSKMEDKDTNVSVTILALNKTKTERFYYPFWRAISTS